MAVCDVASWAPDAIDRYAAESNYSLHMRALSRAYGPPDGDQPHPSGTDDSGVRGTAQWEQPGPQPTSPLTLVTAIESPEVQAQILSLSFELLIARAPDRIRSVLAYEQVPVDVVMTADFVRSRSSVGHGPSGVSDANKQHCAFFAGLRKRSANY